MSGDGSDLLVVVASSPSGADVVEEDSLKIPPPPLAASHKEPTEPPSPVALPPPPTVPTPELPPDSTTADSPTGEMNGGIGSGDAQLPSACGSRQEPSSTTTTSAATTSRPRSETSSPNVSEPELPSSTAEPAAFSASTPPPPSASHIPEPVISPFDRKPPLSNGALPHKNQKRPRTGVLTNLDQIVKKLTCVADPCRTQNGHADNKTDNCQNLPAQPSSDLGSRVALDLSTKRPDVDDAQVKAVKWGIMKSKSKDGGAGKKVAPSTKPSSFVGPPPAEQSTPPPPPPPPPSTLQSPHDGFTPSLQVLRIPQFQPHPHSDTQVRSEIRVTGLTGGATVVTQVATQKHHQHAHPLVQEEKKPYDKRFEVRPTALVNPFPGGEPSSLRPQVVARDGEPTTRPVYELAAALNGAPATAWSLKPHESSDRSELENRRIPISGSRGTGKPPRNRLAQTGVVEFQKALVASAVRLQLPPPPPTSLSFQAQPPPLPSQRVRGAAKRKTSLKNLLVKHVPSMTPPMSTVGQQTLPIQPSDVPVLNKILNSGSPGSESFSVSSVLGGSGGAVSITCIENPRLASVTDPSVVDRLKRLGTVIEVEEDPNASADKEPLGQPSALKMLEKMTFEPPQSPVVSALDDRPLFLNKDISLFAKKKTPPAVQPQLKSPLSIIPVGLPPPPPPPLPPPPRQTLPIPSLTVEPSSPKVQFLPAQVQHLPPLTITKANPKTPSEPTKVPNSPKTIPIPVVTVTKTTSISTLNDKEKPVEVPLPVLQAVPVCQPGPGSSAAVCHSVSVSSGAMCQPVSLSSGTLCQPMAESLATVCQTVHATSATICQTVPVPSVTLCQPISENCSVSEEEAIVEHEFPLPLLEPVIVIDEEEPPLSIDKKFIFKHDNSLSLELPNDQKVFSCDICSAAFHHLHMLRKHYFRLHVARKYISEKDLEAYNIDPEKADDCNDEFLYRCHTCRQCLPTKAELKSHLTDHPPVTDLSKHIKGSKDYKCERCNTHFKWRKVFGKHKRICKAPLMPGNKSDSEAPKPTESDESPTKDEPITAVTELALRQVIDTRALRNSERLARRNVNKQVKSKRKTRQSVALLVHSPPRQSPVHETEVPGSSNDNPPPSTETNDGTLRLGSADAAGGKEIEESGPLNKIEDETDKSDIAVIVESATEATHDKVKLDEKETNEVTVGTEIEPAEVTQEPEQSEELKAADKDMDSEPQPVPLGESPVSNTENEPDQLGKNSNDDENVALQSVDLTPSSSDVAQNDAQIEAVPEVDTKESEEEAQREEPNTEEKGVVPSSEASTDPVVPDTPVPVQQVLPEETSTPIDPPPPPVSLTTEKVDSKGLHPCLYCNETFSNGNKKRTHTLSHHPYVRKNHPCVFCKTTKDTFSTNVALFNHLLTVHPTLYFACSSCKERFLNLEELKNHYSSKRHDLDAAERDSLGSRVSELSNEETTFTCAACTRMFIYKQCFTEHKCNPEKDKAATVEKSTRPPKLRKVKVVERSERNEKPIRVDPEIMFYSQVSYNVRQNLMNFLDGKLPMDDDDEEEVEDESAKLPERNTLSFSAGFPGSGLQLVPEPEPYSRVKAQWEKYSFPKNYDGRCGLTSYIKDMSYLDISTQMIMRRNLQRLQGDHEVTSPTTSDDVPSVLALERLATQTAESFGFNGSAGSDGEVPSLGELSGEWVRDRLYVCSVCSWETPCLWTMEDHKYEIHPQVLCPQHELVGDQRTLSDTIYKRILPVEVCPFSPDRPNLRSTPVTKIPCTKCRMDGFATRYELHVHILACAGEPIPQWAPTPKKRRWPPRKRRRPRRGLKRNIPSTPHRPIKVRTKPGDTDTIQKMIANLPAKRSTRRVIGFDEADLKTRSQSTIQNGPVLLPSNRLVLPPTTSHQKHGKPVRSSPKCKEMILSPPLIPKETDLIDTSAERGDVLSSLRMMPVSTPREELLEPRQIIDKVINQKLLVGEIEDPVSHLCKGCGLTSDSKNALRKHQKFCLYFRECGPNAENKCKTCLRPFDSLVALIEHSCDEMPKLEIEKDIDPVDSAEIPVLSPVPDPDSKKLDDESLKETAIDLKTASNGELNCQNNEMGLQRKRSNSLGDIPSRKKIVKPSHRRSARLGKPDSESDITISFSDAPDSDITYESAPETKKAMLRQKSAKLPSRSKRVKSVLTTETEPPQPPEVKIETTEADFEVAEDDSLWETQAVIEDFDVSKTEELNNLQDKNSVKKSKGKPIKRRPVRRLFTKKKKHSKSKSTKVEEKDKPVETMPSRESEKEDDVQPEVEEDAKLPKTVEPAKTVSKKMAKIGSIKSKLAIKSTNKTSKVMAHTNKRLMKLGVKGKSVLKIKLNPTNAQMKTKQKDLLSYLKKIPSPKTVKKVHDVATELDAKSESQSNDEITEEVNEHMMKAIDSVAKGTSESLLQVLKFHNLSDLLEEIEDKKNGGKTKKTPDKKIKAEEDAVKSNSDEKVAKEKIDKSVKSKKKKSETVDDAPDDEVKPEEPKKVNKKPMKRSSSLDDYLISTIEEKVEVGDEELALQFEELISELNSSLNYGLMEDLKSKEPLTKEKKSKKSPKKGQKSKKAVRRSEREGEVKKEAVVKDHDPEEVDTKGVNEVKEENLDDKSNDKIIIDPPPADIKEETLESDEKPSQKRKKKSFEVKDVDEPKEINTNDAIDDKPPPKRKKLEKSSVEKTIPDAETSIKVDGHEQVPKRETRSSFKSDEKLDESSPVNNELPKRVTRQNVKRFEVEEQSIESSDEDTLLIERLSSKKLPGKKKSSEASETGDVKTKVDESQNEIQPIVFYTKSSSSECNEEPKVEATNATKQKSKKVSKSPTDVIPDVSELSVETELSEADIVADILISVVEQAAASCDNPDTQGGTEELQGKEDEEASEMSTEDEPKAKVNRPYGNKLLSGRLPSAGKAAALLQRKPLHSEPPSVGEALKKRKQVVAGKKLSPARRQTRSNSNSKSDGKSDSVIDPYDYNEDEIVPFQEPRYKPYSPPKPVLYHPPPTKRRARKREDSPDTTTIVVQAEVHPEPPPKRLINDSVDSPEKVPDPTNDDVPSTTTDSLHPVKRKASDQNIGVDEKKKLKKSSDVAAEGIDRSNSPSNLGANGKLTVSPEPLEQDPVPCSNKGSPLMPKMSQLVGSPLRPTSPSIRGDTLTRALPLRPSTPTRLPSPARQIASPSRVSSPARINSPVARSPARMSPVRVQSPRGSSPVNSASILRSYNRSSKPPSPHCEPPQLIDESKVKIEVKLDPDVTSPLLQPASNEPFSDSFDPEPPALEPTEELVPCSKNSHEATKETETAADAEEDADSLKRAPVTTKKKVKDVKLKKKKQLLRIKALRNKKKKEMMKNPVSNSGKEVVKIAGISWEVSELSVSPPKKESPASKDEPVLPELIPVKEEWDSNELWDSPVPMLAPGPVRVQPNVSQLEPMPTQPSMPPIPAQRFHRSDSGSAGPISSLGSILDSVNKLLNEPESNFSQLPADYSLADLQRAMGASDDEMAVLQQLGEATSCLQDFDERSSASQSHCEDEWGPMIMDLDNQAAQQPIVSSSVELPTATTPQPEAEVPPTSVSPAPIPSVSSSVLSGSSTSSVNSGHPKSFKEDMCNLLRGANMCKRFRMVPGSSSTSLLDAYNNKEVVCPTCSLHFMGFQALQAHVNKAHGNSQHDPTQVTGLQNRRVALESAKSSSRLVCFECQQILPSHLMYSHIEVDHSLDHSCIRKCSTVTGDPHAGPVGGERLKSKMSSALGDLLDKAVTNLLTSKNKSEGTATGLTGSAMELLSRLNALRRRDSNRINSKDYSFNKLMMDIRLEDELPKAPLKPYPCSVCGQKFPLATSRNKHEVLAHRSHRVHEPIVKQEVFDDDDWRDAPSPTEMSVDERGNSTLTPTCSDCGLSFDSVTELMKHRVEDHLPRRRLSVSSEANAEASAPVSSSTAPTKAPRRISVSQRSQSLDAQSAESGGSSTSAKSKADTKSSTPSSSPPLKRASRTRAAKCPPQGVKAKVQAALRQLTLPR